MCVCVCVFFFFFLLINSSDSVLVIVALCLQFSLSCSLSLSFFPPFQHFFPFSSLDIYLCLFTGMTFSSKTISDSLNSKAKSAVRKGSTLMKPTASQLAKQNRALQNAASR